MLAREGKDDLEKAESANLAVQKFIEKECDLRQYNTWYNTEILTYLTHLIPQHPDSFRYIFTRDTFDEEQSYYKQFIGLCHLSRELEKCIYFIATESPISQNHFIFGVIVGEEMLIVNPVGITQHQDFSTYIEKIKYYGKLNRIYQSKTVLQQDKDGLTSCGPICVELMQHISQLPFKTLIQSFDKWETNSNNEVDITSLLPQSLQQFSCLKEASYQDAILEKRKEHLNSLKDFDSKASIEVQNQKLDACLGRAEQAVMFELPKVNLGHSEDFLYKIPDGLKSNQKYEALWFKRQYLEAIQRGKLEKVKELLRKNALLLNVLNLKGFTALMLAILSKKETVVRYLLEAGVTRDAGSSIVFKKVLEFARVYNPDFVSLIEGITQSMSNKNGQNSLNCGAITSLDGSIFKESLNVVTTDEVSGLASTRIRKSTVEKIATIRTQSRLPINQRAATISNSPQDTIGREISPFPAATININAPSTGPLNITQQVLLQPLPLSATSDDKLVDWNVPFFEDECFIGQKAYLDKLGEVFQQLDETRIKKFALRGSNGIGKTYIAKQFAYNATAYKFKLWFFATSRTSLVEQYIEFGNEKGLFTENMPEIKKIQGVKKWLVKHPGWLIVYDNAENKKVLSEFLPNKGGHILITSINPHWHGEEEVGVMNEEDAIELLKREADLDEQVIEGNRENVVRLVDEKLGRLPLALAQAGAYIYACGITISDYIERYEKATREMLADETLSQREGIPPIYITWDLSLRKVKEELPKAYDLLVLCSYFDPNNIPRELADKWVRNSSVTASDKEIMLLKRY